VYKIGIATYQLQGKRHFLQSGRSGVISTVHEQFDLHVAKVVSSYSYRKRSNFKKAYIFSTMCRIVTFRWKLAGIPGCPSCLHDSWDTTVQ